MNAMPYEMMSSTTAWISPPAAVALAIAAMYLTSLLARMAGGNRSPGWDRALGGGGRRGGGGSMWDRAGESGRERPRSGGQPGTALATSEVGGLRTGTDPIAPTGSSLKEGHEMLSRMGLTRCPRREGPRDELARLGLLLPALGDPEGGRLA